MKKQILQQQSIIEPIIPDVLDIQKDYIYLGPKKHVRCYVISVFPNHMNIGYLNELFEIDDINISTYIENVPDSDVIRRITGKLTVYQSNMILKQKRGEVIDYAMRQAVDDLDSLREDVQTNKDRMSYVQVMVSIYARTVEELDNKTDIFNDICARKGMKPRILVYDQLKSFINTLPYNNVKITENMRNMTTGGLACLIPTGNTELSHKNGIFLGENVLTSSPIFYDNFIGPPALTNPHMAVFGMAGAGKSVTLKVIAARGVASGEWVIVLDPEAEYQNLIKHLGGQYIEIKSGENSGINPFEIDVEDDGTTKTVNIYGKVSEIREMLSMFCEKFRGRPLHGQEITAVEEVVKELYAKRGITKSVDSLFTEVRNQVDGKFFTGKVKKDMPTLSELREELGKIPYTQELADLMKIITAGGSLALFDGPTKIDFEKKIIGINLKYLTDDFMKFFATVNILSWVWSKFSNWKYKQFKKRVIVDEGWLFAKYERAANFLEEIARRGRKYKICLVIASQMINEFLATDSGKAVIHQCATKLIMKQDPSVAREVTDFFVLSSRCAELVSMFSQGQGLLLTETDLVVMKVITFDFEKQYVTT